MCTGSRWPNIFKKLRICIKFKIYNDIFYKPVDQISCYNTTINILNQNLVIFITSAIDLSQDSRLIFCVIYSCCQKKNGVLSFIINSVTMYTTIGILLCRN